MASTAMTAAESTTVLLQPPPPFVDMDARLEDPALTKSRLALAQSELAQLLVPELVSLVAAYLPRAVPPYIHVLVRHARVRSTSDGLRAYVIVRWCDTVNDVKRKLAIEGMSFVSLSLPDPTPGARRNLIEFVPGKRRFASFTPAATGTSGGANQPDRDIDLSLAYGLQLCCSGIKNYIHEFKHG